MARLPTPGSDDGSWGTILNDFLSQALNSDGTLKGGAVNASSLSAGSGSNGQVLTKDSAQASGMKWAAAPGSSQQIFVQNTDPGASANDGDIWIDTSL
ncbi:MAG TPA: hypothetical protein VF466_05310 [Candidatus Saccharimonadales bacterium]